MDVKEKIRNFQKWVNKHLLLLGVLSIIWLALRTGTKPSRINYPCQKAALVNSIVLLAAFPSIYWLHAGFQSARQGAWVVQKYGAAIKANAMSEVIIVLPSSTACWMVRRLERWETTYRTSDH